jgi:hypothetical protein
MYNKSQVAEQIVALFGDPPLIKGEDSERYFKLLDAVAHSVEPKTVYDLMMVKDITDKYWEEIRLRRSAAALIDGAYVKALALLLEPFCSMPDVPTDIARRYCDGDKVAKKQTASRLAAHGITEEQIQAKAVEIIGNALLMIDRMMGSREVSRRRLRKENKRRFEKEDVVPGYVS